MTRNNTLDYYNENARDFAAFTVAVDFAVVQDRFLALLSAGERILDFGCGSGRDAKRFLDEGFAVEATDGCPELCRIASDYTGIPVRNELFEELSAESAYDGIWACSSILHVSKAELPNVFGKMVRALRPAGVIYTSFKYGDYDGMRNGRHFSDFTESSFAEFLREVEGLALEDQWVTGDVRPGRGEEKWLNLILRKK